MLWSRLLHRARTLHRWTGGGDGQRARDETRTMASTIPLYRRKDLLDRAHTPHRIAAAERRGDLVRVRPGVFAAGGSWRTAMPEHRVVARAHALALAMAATPVFSHETAAAIHGLALYRSSRDRVHTIAPLARPGASTGVVRHRGELEAEDVVEVGGLLCTSLARTVSDMARTATFDQSVTVADATLRRLFVPGPGRYDAEGADGFRRTVLDVARRSAHGLTRATRVVAFADGRAQLPGETVSRIRLRTLGFREIDLQVAVPGPLGRAYYVDFGLEDVTAFGEFDGSIKYVDGRLLDGRSSSQALDEEKQREDWIRGTTQRRYARWGWPHIETAAALGARLAAFGIRPPA